LVTPSDLPQSALHYVIRAQESVLLDDALADSLYSKDEYIERKRARSVLCLPIVKQGKLVGALYLENNLAPFVFTPDRVAVLQLLASQAAISLENASLYSALQLQAGLLQRLPVAAWMLNADGTPNFVNQVWLEFSGQTLDFVRSHPEAWMTVIHPEDREAASRAFWDGVRSGQDFAFETRSLRARDGTYRWHLQQAVVLRDSEGKVLKFVGTTTDIDEQKNAEVGLQRAYDSFSDAQRLSKTGNFVADLATDDHYWSEEALRIFEFKPGTKITLQRIREVIHPDDLASFESVIAGGVAEGGANFSFRIITARGREKHLRGVAHAVEEVAGRPLLVGAIQDVTESVLAEEALNRARSELANISRVMAMSTLTAAIAHEVNQPLSGIVTNAGTCLRLLDATPPKIDLARETARRTIRDANRASEVVTRLRALFSKKEATYELFDLNDATKEVIALSASELRRNRVIPKLDLATDLAPVSGDRIQIQQVILNLVRNGSDAMSAVFSRPRVLLIKTERDQSSGVRLSVKDSGIGISAEIENKLFEAFYSTKDEGMGMGLSVSRSIIEIHRGRIWAIRNEGPGATFLFSIPCGTNT
jgi:PAS domain S-box-containing protein